MRDYYKKKTSPWPRRLLTAALLAVLAISAINLISYGVDLARSRSLNDELAEEMRRGEALEAQQAAEPQQTASASRAEAGTGNEAEAAPTQTPVPQLNLITAGSQMVNPNQKPEILLSLSGLWERNNDLVGWLTMQALPAVDLPVVQRDHTYYLRRDFNGRSNVNGTAFMDVSCSIWPRSDNLIIYAHNMKSGEMFGGLQKLRKEIFYRANPLATFSSLYERATYVPLAVVQCSIHQGEDFFNFAVADFRNEAAFDAFIARARELSDVQPPYDAVYGDRLLTLVTCIDDAGEERLLVILRQVRENENPDELYAMWQ